MRNYFVWLCVFAFFALLIYDVKYSVGDAHKVTLKMEAELQRERQRFSILEVEWAMLTRPERIKAMAAKHLPNLIEVNNLSVAGAGLNGKISTVADMRLLEEQAAIWRISVKNDAPHLGKSDAPQTDEQQAQNVNQIVVKE